jgi:membrane associated rhomboid family serine protease
MLENRDYMRNEPSSGNPMRFQWSASVVLMIVLVITFAFQRINDVYGKPGIEDSLALTPAAFVRGHVWQLLTFQFLHNSLWHLIGNLMGLWFFGRWVENILGANRFLVAYFGCGVVGGLLQSALMVLFPAHFGALVLGASAGVMGIFAIFARLESDSEIRLNFILPIRAGILLWITVGISLFFTLVPSPRGGGIAHAAHLGGILAGLAWVKLGWHRDFVALPWENLLGRLRFWRPFQARQRKQELVRAASAQSRPWRTAGVKAEPDLAPEEFISREVDPILDKISAHGIQSLTERERKILADAQKKMAKR